MTTTSPDSAAGPDQIQAEIENTRAQLADTVDALAAKFDVGAQARSAVQGVRENVVGAAHGAAERAAGAAGKVKETITGVAGGAAERAENVAKTGKVKARDAVGQVSEAAGQLRDRAPVGVLKPREKRHGRSGTGGATYSVTDDGALLVQPVPFYRRRELQVGAGVFVVGAIVVLFRGLR